MCRHFVKDEHYNFFDDMYASDYAINDLQGFFNNLMQQTDFPAVTPKKTARSLGRNSRHRSIL